MPSWHICREKLLAAPAMNPVVLFCVLGTTFAVTNTGLDEVVLVGGPNHSPQSTVKTNFSTNIKSGQGYHLKWKFDDIPVCNIIISRGTLDTGSTNCHQMKATYYSNNSDVNATLISGVLAAVFTYSNAREENNSINVSVRDMLNISRIYGDATLIVAGCPDPPNTVHRIDNSSSSSSSYCADNFNFYDCDISFSCKDGYYDDSVTANCQANATWSHDISCVLETTAATTLQSTSSESTVVLTSTSENSPDTGASTTSDNGDVSGNENGLGIPAIVGIAVGGAAIILICGGIWVWRRKISKNDSSAREERDNPLYGTTPANRMDEEYETAEKKKKKEKEEKVNPLYQSSQEAKGAAIEPAYGSVEVNADEAGPSGSAINQSISEVTYAAVNKNKKSGTNGSTANQENSEVMYAAVQKPRKKDKTSTNDTSVENTSEVTYSAVNKLKKKDKAGTNDFVMDANISEVTYATVNKPKKNK